VPMVETCARLAWQSNIMTIAANNKRCMMITPFAPD
jgi:hypothetical protein